MKKFDIPEFYRSPLIKRVKELRTNLDRRKKDFSPSQLDFDKVQILLPRHFGFCFGVENAIEISYRAIEENPEKKIYLLSQMIHNPGVNEDLESHGLTFIQDTYGKQLIDWEVIKKEDIVIIPAFGTTREIEELLTRKGVQIEKYNTTCPFVERVWKRSKQLGESNHTVIIHGKDYHEETRATFSHTTEYAKALVVKDIEETKVLSEFMLGKADQVAFEEVFKGRYSKGFDPKSDLNHIGVVNQTTMLASDTQEIADFLHDTIVQKFGAEASKDHFANTRDTLCYATNDNQSATLEILKSNADLAIVVGGYNSSNTSHLVELCEEKFTTFFVKDETELLSRETIQHFDLSSKTIITSNNYLPQGNKPKIIVTSGASCPDAVLERVIKRVLTFYETDKSIEEVISEFEARYNA
ncbi:MAG: 4-hydroxy-3-methylbut-2-enyl diphosphate reductase [Crocinitomicaceae bacterium]|nr:4-hydroxy-3-methylbut-2-enyl diphosphate reductase [Crocinitomicaceae bacterium]